MSDKPGLVQSKNNSNFKWRLIVFTLTLNINTGLNRENLYRVLSEKGNPVLASLEKLLKSLGLRLSVEVDQDMNHAA